MPPDQDPASVTVLLRRAGNGDPGAASALFQLLYEELRARAHRILHTGQGGSTLQPTLLVHEAWLKLCPGQQPAFHDRAHFLRVAASAMRSVLVDHMRARATQKRGGGNRRLEVDELCAAFADRADDLLALDEALTRLAARDATSARVVELRFFAGLPIAETAAALGVSTATVERSWRAARAWLRAELDDGDGAGAGASPPA